MCKAHILRFCCGHGVLMGLETCNIGPCPIIKTTGNKLPQQPYKCYNCQHKLSSPSTRVSASRTSSCNSSIGSLDSVSSTSSTGRPTPSRANTVTVITPLPGVAKQPAGCMQYGSTLSRSRSYSKPFGFSCSSSSHYPMPHYQSLPGHLPHQDHPCPPCQLENFRSRADREAMRSAVAQFPHLTGDMLVRNGRIRENWQSNLTLDKFVDEKRTEEREMWLHVTRKWTQDLRKARVLVAEEDGLGLLG